MSETLRVKNQRKNNKNVEQNAKKKIQNKMYCQNVEREVLYNLASRCPKYLN